MKNKFKWLFPSVLLICFFAFSFGLSDKNDIEYVNVSKFIKPILFSEAYPIVTSFDAKLSDDRIQLASYDDWKSSKDKLIEKSDIYLFSDNEFQKEENEALIRELIAEGKTVLFYGYRLDVPNSIKGKEDLFPYYTIESSKEIHHFLYGYGFSKGANSYLPITVMGNLTKDNMTGHITNYIYKYIQEDFK